MRLFLDNDIILKLSSLGILNEIEIVFSCTSENIFILPSARHFIAKSSSVKNTFNKEVIDTALDSIKDYSNIPDHLINEEKLIELSQIEGIDSGEQILFSLDQPDDNFLILTGDKRAIEALSNSPLSKDYSGKIVCLEKLIIEFLGSIEFEILSSKIIGGEYGGDKVLKICFAQKDINRENVLIGLNSYYSDLKSKTGNILY